MSRSRLTSLPFLGVLVLCCRPAAPAPATIEDIQYAAVAIDLDSANLRQERRAVYSRDGTVRIVVRFRTGRQLRKVAASIGNDAGWTHETFYLHDGAPFLVVTQFPSSAAFRRGRKLTLIDSLYYAQGRLLRSMSVNSPDVVPVERKLSTPLDSVTDRLNKYLSLKSTR